MRFIGTSPWTEETGGYEFRLSEDGTLVHLHDADIVRVDYRQDIGQLRLCFRYDPEFAEGLLRERPILLLYFRNCTILEWENDFLQSDPTSGGADLSVNLLDLYSGGILVFESVPARIRLSADEVQVEAVAEAPPDDMT